MNCDSRQEQNSRVAEQKQDNGHQRQMLVAVSLQVLFGPFEAGPRWGWLSSGTEDEAVRGRRVETLAKNN